MKKLKKSLAVFMAVLMIASVFNVSVSAATYTYTLNAGTYGTIISSMEEWDGMEIISDDTGLIPLPNYPIYERTGYTQTGWSYSKTATRSFVDFSGASETIAVKATRTRTIYPYWTINTYTVTYLPGQYGTGTETSVSVNYNKTVTLEGAIFTRDGYTQTGWSLEDGGEKVYDLSVRSGIVTDNITLYPYWTENECGSNLTHTWEDGVCTVCGVVCGTDVEHIWSAKTCINCGAICGTDVEHSWENGACTTCGVICGTDVEHTFKDSICTVCGTICGIDIEHIWESSVCTICGKSCGHIYENGICSACGIYETAILVTAENYEALNLTENYIGYYAIGNAGQLYWFRDYVNSNTQLAGTETAEDTTDDVYSTSANAVLINDVDLNPGITFEVTIDADGDITSKVYDENGNMVSDYVWWENAIGYDSTIPYTGVFDGRDFSIGAYKSIDVALFGYNNGTIKNLKVTNGIFGTFEYKGVFCFANTGDILNCTNYISCESGDGMVGGICGYNEGGKISGCANYGYIINGGGICSVNEGGTISNCVNYGFINYGGAFAPKIWVL